MAESTVLVEKMLQETFGDEVNPDDPDVIGENITDISDELLQKDKDTPYVSNNIEDPALNKENKASKPVSNDRTFGAEDSEVKIFCNLCSDDSSTNFDTLVKHYSLHHFREIIEKEHDDNCSLLSGDNFVRNETNWNELCYLCKKEFSDREELIMHIGLAHNFVKLGLTSPRDSSQCSVCKKEFINENFHDQHLISSHFSKQIEKEFLDAKSQLECKFCQKQFSNKHELIIHIGIDHNKVKSFFKNEKKFDPNAQMKCKHCTFLSDISNMKMHYLEAHFFTNLEEKCNQEGLLRKENKCQYCDDSVDNKKELVKHLGFKHNQILSFMVGVTEKTGYQRNIISQCEVKVATESNLQNPSSTNPGPAKVPENNNCNDKNKDRIQSEDEVQNAGNKSKESEKVIIHVDSAVKIPCSLCFDQSSTNFADLLKHYSIDHFQDSIEKKHVPSWTGSCDFCKKEFTSKPDLIMHIGLEHNALQVEISSPKGGHHCPICKKEFINSVFYHQHLIGSHFGRQIEEEFLSVSSEFQLTCQFCEQEFDNKENILIHIGVSHGKLEPHLAAYKDEHSAKTTVDIRCKYCNHSSNFSLMKLHYLEEHFFSKLEGKCKEENLLNQRNKCDLCNKRLKNKTDLLKHLGVNHNKILSFIVSVCGPSSRRRTAFAQLPNIAVRFNEKETVEEVVMFMEDDDNPDDVTTSDLSEDPLVEASSTYSERGSDKTNKNRKEVTNKNQKRINLPELRRKVEIAKKMEMSKTEVTKSHLKSTTDTPATISNPLKIHDITVLPFSCTVCREIFPSEDKVKVHMIMFHYRNLLHSKLKEKQFEVNPPLPGNTAGQTCPKLGCRKIFRDENYLINHFIFDHIIAAKKENSSLVNKIETRFETDTFKVSQNELPSLQDEKLTLQNEKPPLQNETTSQNNETTSQNNETTSQNNENETPPQNVITAPLSETSSPLNKTISPQNKLKAPQNSNLSLISSPMNDEENLFTCEVCNFTSTLKHSFTTHRQSLVHKFNIIRKHSRLEDIQPTGGASERTCLLCENKYPEQAVFNHLETEHSSLWIKERSSVVSIKTEIQSESINADQSKSTNPSQSESTNPSQSKSTNPSQTESTNPSQSKSTNPSQSESINTSQSKSTNPSQSESIKPSLSKSTNQLWFLKFKKFCQFRKEIEGAEDCLKNDFKTCSASVLDSFLKEMLANSENIEQLDNIIKEIGDNVTSFEDNQSESMIDGSNIETLQIVKRYILVKEYGMHCQKFGSNVKECDPMSVIIFLSQLMGRPNVSRADMRWFILNVSDLHAGFNGEPLKGDQRIFGFFKAINIQLPNSTPSKICKDDDDKTSKVGKNKEDKTTKDDKQSTVSKANADKTAKVCQDKEDKTTKDDETSTVSKSNANKTSKVGKDKEDKTPKDHKQSSVSKANADKTSKVCKDKEDKTSKDDFESRRTSSRIKAKNQENQKEEEQVSNDKGNQGEKVDQNKEDKTCEFQSKTEDKKRRMSSRFTAPGTETELSRKSIKGKQVAIDGRSEDEKLTAQNTVSVKKRKALHEDEIEENTETKKIKLSPKVMLKKIVPAEYFKTQKQISRKKPEKEIRDSEEEELRRPEEENKTNEGNNSSVPKVKKDATQMSKQDASQISDQTTTALLVQKICKKMFKNSFNPENEQPMSENLPKSSSKKRPNDVKLSTLEKQSKLNLPDLTINTLGKSDVEENLTDILNTGQVVKIVEAGKNSKTYNIKDEIMEEDTSTLQKKSEKQTETKLIQTEMKVDKVITVQKKITIPTDTKSKKRKIEENKKTTIKRKSKSIKLEISDQSNKTFSDQSNVSKYEDILTNKVFFSGDRYIDIIAW